MKKLVLSILTLSSSLALACEGENEIESFGGPVSDGYTTSFSQGRQQSRLRGGLGANALGGNAASIECIDLGTIVASGTYPGFGWSWIGGFNWQFLGSGGGGGGTPVVPTQTKLNYCDARDKAIALLSAMRVTGTAVAGYSLAQGSFNWAQAIVSTGLRDIELYIAVGERNPTSYSDGTINWRTANINWNLYNSWQNYQNAPAINPSNSLPTPHNGGSRQVLMNFLYQTGQGTGTINAMIGPDPQPSISCD